MRLCVIEKAKVFATGAHWALDHRRRFTQEPYTVHLEAVAALVSAVTQEAETIASAWLHDVVEDTKVTPAVLLAIFGDRITDDVIALTDVPLSAGNRAHRNALNRAWLGDARSSAQTIKLADLIDNAPSIIQYDPHFAKVFMAEMAAMIAVLDKGDRRLRETASMIVEDYNARS